MRKSTILILESRPERITAFRQAAASLGDARLQIWSTAPAMLAELDAYLNDACLISLAHDLSPGGEKTESGTGLEIAEHLCEFPPVCPVILHCSNNDRVWSMHNEFRYAGWQVERIAPEGDDWVSKLWLPKASELLTRSREADPFRLRPADHSERMARARLSLTGLSIGDAFGECFFGDDDLVIQRLAKRELPPAPWIVTDDSVMALSIVETLDRFGEVERNSLARAFARRYREEPGRGYGTMAHGILRQIGEGRPWPKVAHAAFNGMGSMGNGGAMRAAPIGAYFGEQTEKVIEQAAWSAEVTHAHPDGQAGAIAVALGAAWAATHASDAKGSQNGSDLLAFCHEHTPDGPTRDGIANARSLPIDTDVQTAASTLGNGSNVVAHDTVPFCLWCAARHFDNYEQALWTTVSGLGDRDTTCAIVGGIVVLSAGEQSIPRAWLEAREALPD